MNSKSIPIVSLSGEPYERGRKHGELARRAIHANIRTYLHMFHHRAGLNKDAALRRATEFLPVIEDYSPDLLAEMRGIAAGASVTVPEILALNCRSEIVFGAGVADQGCTSFAIVPDSGGSVIGQNWDWHPDIAGRTLLLLIQMPGGESLATFTEAGMVGKIGCNEAGLGVCLNSLTLLHCKPKLGVPVHVLLRTVLEKSRNVTDAATTIVQADRAASANYLLADQHGAALDLETTPDDFGWVYPENGLITHSNHFQVERFQANDAGRTRSPDTIMRSYRARQVLSDLPDKSDLSLILRAMGDHQGYPNSICRHLDERTARDDRWVTLGSLVVDLKNGKMLVGAGNPCQGRFSSLTFAVGDT